MYCCIRKSVRQSQFLLSPGSAALPAEAAFRMIWVILLCWTAVSAAGCRLYPDTHEIVVHMPEVSGWEVIAENRKSDRNTGGEENDGRPWYLLMWPAEEDELMKMHVPAERREVRVRHAKGHDVPFIALPFGRGRPAGGWFSYGQHGPVKLEWNKGRFAETMLRFRQQYPRRAAVLCFTAWYECIQQKIHGDSLPVQIDLPRFDRRELLTGLTAGVLNETIAAADPWIAVGKKDVEEKLLQVYDPSSFSASVIPLDHPPGVPFCPEPDAADAPDTEDAEKDAEENAEGYTDQQRMERKWILERNPEVVLDFDDAVVDEILLSCMETYRFYAASGGGCMMITVQAAGNWTVSFQ